MGIKDKKIFGEQRRSLILKWLRTEEIPLTGSLLAKKTNVSRQVIVQDISLLKARNEPIIATSQGYIYIQSNDQKKSFNRIIACNHTPEQTGEELRIIVDFGVTVKDVIIEHPLYGELTASIMVRNRRDVDQFLNKVEKTNASLLSELTGGTHLHTLIAENEEQLNEVCKALGETGFLVKA